MGHKEQEKTGECRRDLANAENKPRMLALTNGGGWYNFAKLWKGTFGGYVSGRVVWLADIAKEEV